LSSESHPTTRFAPTTFPTLSTALTQQHLEAARARGYSAGYAEGTHKADRDYAARSADLEVTLAAEIEFGRARAARVLAILNAAVASLTARLEPSLQEAEETFLAASIELAEAILGVELQDHAASARAAVLRILRTPHTAHIIAVRLNPDDLQVVRLDAGLPAGVDLIPDESITRGDAVAELAAGILDARISTALRRAREELSGQAL
jgi:flagellar assembly protein FliH